MSIPQKQHTWPQNYVHPHASTQGFVHKEGLGPPEPTHGPHIDSPCFGVAPDVCISFYSKSWEDGDLGNSRGVLQRPSPAPRAGEQDPLLPGSALSSL